MQSAFANANDVVSGVDAAGALGSDEVEVDRPSSRVERSEPGRRRQTMAFQTGAMTKKRL